MNNGRNPENPADQEKNGYKIESEEINSESFWDSIYYEPETKTLPKGQPIISSIVFWVYNKIESENDKRWIIAFDDKKIAYIPKSLCSLNEEKKIIKIPKWLKGKIILNMSKQSDKSREISRLANIRDKHNQMKVAKDYVEYEYLEILEETKKSWRILIYPNTIRWFPKKNCKLDHSENNKKSIILPKWLLDEIINKPSK